ncbi:MAG: acyl-CoA thioesterase [Desulfobulbaceae bacterium]|nr:acyl-CoA thioesterase [Desulfobulbaceae bacterium]
MKPGKIETPETAHQCQWRVLYGDTDSGGVVYYANYLRYFEHGRTELMRDRCCTYRDLEDQGFIMPVVESYLRYKASAAYDDLLNIRTALVELKSVSCKFNYTIFRESDQKLLVKGFTVHAVVNRAGRLVKFPEDVYRRLQNIITQQP